MWLRSPTLNPTSNNFWQAGGYGHMTLLHELGHGLGLKHPFDDQPRLPAAQDTRQYTVMSYQPNAKDIFHWITVTSPSDIAVDAVNIVPDTPMLYDIAAMQALYGVNMGYRVGDDVYTFDPNTPFFRTLWDAGGNDTISVANFSRGTIINLLAGQYSKISIESAPLPNGFAYDGSFPAPTYDGTNNLAIAFGATIENATGGAGPDTLLGNAAGNRLEGGGGDDAHYAYEGNDTLLGGSGNDTINGGDGADVVVYAGPRSDYIVTWDQLNDAYTITARAPAAGQPMSNFDGSDLVTNVETFQFADGALTGGTVLDTNAPTILTFSPADEAVAVAITSNVVLTFSEAIARGTGTITLKTSAGAIVESYNAADSGRLSLSGSTLTIDPTNSLLNNTGYRVDFAVGTIKDLSGNGYAGTNTYNFTTAIANQTINGTTAADSLTGGSGNDTINGLASDDRLTGGMGNDSLDGGAGRDTATFSGTRAQYTISKTVGVTGGTTIADNQPGRDGTDTTTNIEVLRFSDRSVDLTMASRIAGVSAADLKMLEELYVGFFNRVPEAEGLGYWIGQIKGGASMVAIADCFYQAGIDFGPYQPGMSNQDFIRAVYGNVLGRPTPGPNAPGQAEIDYWNANLVAGSHTKGKMVLSMITAVHADWASNSQYGWVSDLLNNKAAVAHFYAIEQGLSLNVVADNVTYGIEIATRITPESTQAAIDFIGVNPFNQI